MFLLAKNATGLAAARISTDGSGRLSAPPEPANRILKAASLLGFLFVYVANFC
ncbi:hypothetical protein [Pseudoteredinibacter isoporae]|uniref:Uncharacterized protein n=1 Tax=Pseudoteredinibacter isoporae TaxID=570281 RepID=A0A7X0JU59_9GAMM|nr:hypothetical protein [Pseudoteredinibacter isoporae]MBB6521391.1 hypothetical protein [Pseudoteredinibacter isoporae]NHO86946.1 hypothetical protein [Pseudoteredinibacter isoporae]NIB24601.1 hypothetical protein [Pseudoteredinibacter isoporae]